MFGLRARYVGSWFHFSRFSDSEFEPNYFGIFSSQIATFLVYAVLSVCKWQSRQNKMTSLLLLDNFYSVAYEFKRKRKRRIVAYGSATRYGPRASCQKAKRNQGTGQIFIVFAKFRRFYLIPSSSIDARSSKDRTIALKFSKFPEISSPCPPASLDCVKSPSKGRQERAFYSTHVTRNDSRPQDPRPGSCA